MRVLFLNSEYPPLGGGAGSATDYLLKTLSAYPGLAIDLITSSPDRFEERSLSPRIRVVSLDIKKRGESLQSQSLFELIRYIRETQAYIKRHIRIDDYDLVHAFFGLPAGYVAAKIGLPYILSLRGSDVPGHNPALRHIYPFVRPLLRNIYKKAAFVVANSDDLKREAESFCSLPYQVIPNGVDTDLFSRASGIQTSPFRILYVGRLHRIKRIDILLKGFCHYLSQSPHVTSELVIVGDGPESHSLRLQAQHLGIASSVRFLGHIPHEQLPPIYQEASVFVLPSYREGMSNTVLEAMASGLPVLITATGGASTLINGSGIVIEPTADALATALVECASNPFHLTEMGVESRRVAESMSWSNAAAAYFSLYTRI